MAFAQPVFGLSDVTAHAIRSAALEGERYVKFKYGMPYPSVLRFSLSRFPFEEPKK